MASEKMRNMYRLQLQEVMLRNQSQADQFLEVEFDNHDDLFKVIGFVVDKNLFNDKNQSIEFAIGLKLFTEVMLKNKENPLFDELKPAMLQFMKRLKSQ